MLSYTSEIKSIVNKQTYKQSRRYRHVTWKHLGVQYRRSGCMFADRSTRRRLLLLNYLGPGLALSRESPPGSGHVGPTRPHSVHNVIEMYRMGWIFESFCIDLHIIERVRVCSASRWLSSC